jgi:hypothetical protein
MELESWSRPARGLHRYVQLVAEELGCSGDAFCVQTESPLSAYLPMEQRLPRHPNRDLALLWDEHNGWCLAMETASGEDLLVVAYHGNSLLPRPKVVARFAEGLIADSAVGQPDPPEFEITPNDLAAALDRYAPEVQLAG